jgi:hypothetical protein
MVQDWDNSDGTRRGPPFGVGPDTTDGAGSRTGEPTLGRGPGRVDLNWAWPPTVHLTAEDGRGSFRAD